MYLNSALENHFRFVSCCEADVGFFQGFQSYALDIVARSIGYNTVVFTPLNVGSLRHPMRGEHSQGRVYDLSGLMERPGGGRVVSKTERKLVWSVELFSVLSTNLAWLCSLLTLLR